MTRHQHGGCEKNVLHTIDWERRAGHEVHIAVGVQSDRSDLPTDLTVHVVPHFVREVRPDLDLLALRQLRHLIQAGRYDIVHTHQSKAGSLGRLASKGGRRQLVHTVHMSSFGQAYGAIPSQLYLLAERDCARTTDRDLASTVGVGLREDYLAAGVGRPTSTR